MAKRRLIERYVLRTIFPYGVAALLLLTAILFVQQTGRYFETVFHGIMPAEFVYGLALALLPTVLIFTIPMAVLCGTIIGLSRMSSDSELVAMRAAGVGTWRTLWAALLVGLVAAPAARDQSYVVERLETLRITFPTGRSTLVAKLQKPDANPDEMGFSDLRRYVAASKGIEHREAEIIFHKRLAFAIAPFVFALFGSALALRMRRGS